MCHKAGASNSATAAANQIPASAEGGDCIGIGQGINGVAVALGSVSTIMVPIERHTCTNQ
ncbi:hypothetical protein D5085_05860 [Ectothiorhodospiraceae bacterium BW-2]|nr:hypothetical protein D5085_05860 [Ectothiorhodospiraceae bacterium BW-2]